MVGHFCNFTRLDVALFYHALTDLYTLRPRADRCARVGRWHDDTITGIGQILELRKSNLRVVAVELTGGAVLSRKPSGPHKIHGIGAAFVPDIIDRSIIDEIVTDGNQPAFDIARELA